MAGKQHQPIFSLSHIAQELLNAGRAINQDDQGTQLFFERVAKAIETAEGGGKRPDRPIYGGILFGDTDGGEHVGAAPLDLIVETLARTWLGTSSDGSAPLCTIHCMQYYPGQHPEWFRELLGPPKQTDGAIIFSDVAQYSIEEPHRLLKTEHEKIPYVRWMQQFFDRIIPRLVALNEQLKSLSKKSIHIDRELSNLADHVNQVQMEIDQRHEPYFSVVVFKNVDVAPPEFIAQVLMPILTTGKLPLHYGGGMTDFTRSIVLMTAQDRDGIVPKGMTLGFPLPNNQTQSRRASFLKVRKAISNYRWGTLLDAIGDELVIIGPRTKEAQMMLLEHELNIIQQRLEQHGIFAVFDPTFKEWLLWQTREPQRNELGDEGVWTDAMLQTALERNVRNPLSRVALAGKLYRGGTIIFRVEKTLALQRSRDALMAYASEPPRNSENFDSAYLAKALQEAVIDYPDTPDIEKLEQHTQSVIIEAQRRLAALMLTRQAGPPRPPGAPNDLDPPGGSTGPSDTET